MMNFCFSCCSTC